MVRFTDVTTTFPGGLRALDGVSLDVPRAQFCVVLGSSGAGKSTLLRAVNGLTPPSAGTVTVDGVVLAPKTLARVRSQVAMVHQQFNLVGRMTVLTNVLTGALQRVSTARAVLSFFPREYERKACTLLADVGLEEQHLYRRARELSGGQQQRVAIARAFILDPKVVLADEPVASLDETSGKVIMRLLRDTSAKHGTTVLCSLHQVDLARQFADRVVGMHGGQVVYDGSPGGLDDVVLERIYARRGDGPGPEREAPANGGVGLRAAGTAP